MPDVDLEGHAHEGHGIVRARRLHLEPTEELAEPLVVPFTGGDVGKDVAFAPPLHDVLDRHVLLELLPGRLAPGPVVGRLFLDFRPAEDEGLRALGIRRGEQHR